MWKAPKDSERILYSRWMKKLPSRNDKLSTTPTNIILDLAIDQTGRLYIQHLHKDIISLNYVLLYTWKAAISLFIGPLHQVKLEVELLGVLRVCGSDSDREIPDRNLRQIARWTNKFKYIASLSFEKEIRKWLRYN